jgi:hypothetical protein
MNMIISERDMLKEIVSQFITVCEKYEAWDKVGETYYDAKKWLINEKQKKFTNKLLCIEDVDTKDRIWGKCEREDKNYIYIWPFYSTEIGDVKLSTQLKRFSIKESIIKEV